MGENRTQNKWDCSNDGLLTVLMPSGLKGEFDLTEIFESWADYTPAEKFFSGYGVKQKLSDLCAKSKKEALTDAEKLEAMEKLFNYAVDNQKLPEVKRAGGFGISKKAIAEKIEKREVPLTEDQIALMKELGLMD